MNWIITIVIITSALAWALTYRYQEIIDDQKKEIEDLKKYIKDKSKKDNRGRY
jgi:hypothetical protein